MSKKLLTFIGILFVGSLSINTYANTTPDSIRADLDKLRLVNLKCATVSSDPFDSKHLNCYTNVFNKASQIGNMASKFLNNEEASRVLVEHNKNFSQLVANCDQLYAGQQQKFKVLSMQCKATNKLGWAMFIPAIMK